MVAYTSREKEIAKAFRLTPYQLHMLTPYQLHILLRIRRGDGISGNNTGPVLDRLGYTARNPHDGIRQTTNKGREVVARAREMGL